MNVPRFGFLALSVVLCLIGRSSLAADQDAVRRYEQTVQKGLNYLVTKGQADDGSFTKSGGPAITALCTTALLQNGRSPDDPVVKKSLKYLEKFVREDGGIYTEKSPFQNYETCVSILCLSAANRDGRYAQVLKKADAFIKGLQWSEGQGKSQADFEFGGAGYGDKKRPDLSNTAFFIDALKAAGSDNDEALRKAIVFISRCQNLESQHNTAPFAAKNQDGGFIYTPVGGGDSPAGKTENGGLRSYALMTYAGLKSMIYAGVTKDDPRVKAAYKWCQTHYSLADNPGMGSAGLYYYYHTFAKALDAMGEAVIEADGQRHEWRAELVAELAKRQRPDGSWVNENTKWMEGDTNLATAFALLALSHCQPK